MVNLLLASLLSFGIASVAGILIAKFHPNALDRMYFQFLMQAVRKCDLETITTLLIKRPHLLNYHDEKNDTLLNYAVRCGNSGSALYLVDLGADVNYANDSGFTATDYAEIAGMEWLANELKLSGGKTTGREFGYAYQNGKDVDIDKVLNHPNEHLAIEGIFVFTNATGKINFFNSIINKLNVDSDCNLISKRLEKVALAHKEWLFEINELFFPRLPDKIKSQTFNGFVSRLKSLHKIIKSYKGSDNWWLHNESLFIWSKDTGGSCDGKFTPELWARHIFKVKSISDLENHLCKYLA